MLSIQEASLLLLGFSYMIVYHSAKAGDLDISSLIDCGLADFVGKNHRTCYRASIEGDPCNPMGCTATIIPRTNFSIAFEPSLVPGGPIQTKFWTPGKIRNPPRNYQNNRICRYHVVCPEGQLLHFGFRTGNMDLEPETSGLCLDYMFVENLSGDSLVMCGSQTETSWRRSGPLRVEFRSNTRGRYPGFQIDAICVRPEFANLPGCTSPDDDSATTTTPVMGRRKRSLARDKRSYIPLIGNTLRLPRNGSIRYKHNLLLVIVDDTIVRKFRNIRRLFFWTAFNGTQVFTKSTDEFIFGSGVLKIIKGCGYYYTFEIPPNLEPTESELELISLLLNATAPFFADQDILDKDTKNVFPSHLGLNKFAKGDQPIKPHYIKRRFSYYPPVTTPPPLDPRISAEALATAENWQDACNVFLRESALSYLLTLAARGILP